MSAATDPYRILGISPQASAAELRAAYRRAVQREHPDHNGGSAEAARRFEAVQEAYAVIRVERERRAAARSGASSGATAAR
ncbi:MAG: J domain-containing protein, partial [Actinomycetota bacterium]|nr:J domain-containing protein [Actinomycetota bacterium]